MIDEKIALMLNKNLKSTKEVLEAKKNKQQDPNNSLGEIIHDESISKNPKAIKPGMADVLHKDALDKAMQGGSNKISPDDVLKEKLRLKQLGIYDKLIKESEGAPIVPYGGNNDYSKRKQRLFITNNINVYKTSYLSNKASKKLKRISNVK